MTGSNVGKIEISAVIGEYPGTVTKLFSQESLPQDSGQWQFYQASTEDKRLYSNAYL